MLHFIACHEWLMIPRTDGVLSDLKTVGGGQIPSGCNYSLANTHTAFCYTFVVILSSFVSKLVCFSYPYYSLLHSNGSYDPFRMERHPACVYQWWIIFAFFNADWYCISYWIRFQYYIRFSLESIMMPSRFYIHSDGRLCSLEQAVEIHTRIDIAHTFFSP